MLKAWAPRVAEHTLQNANNFRRNVWLAGWIVNFEWVEGHWELRIGRVEIDDIFDAVLWDELEVIHREVAMWIDNTITLVVINIAKRKKREETRLTGAGLTNDIDMAATVFAVHAELCKNRSVAAL